MDKYWTTRYVTLKPLDERAKPLMVPVTCYRPALQNVGLPSVDVRPDRIALGILAQGGKAHFRLYGEESLVRSRLIKNVTGFSMAATVDLLRLKDGQLSDIVVNIGDRSPPGLFRGKICLKAPDNREFSIAVFGDVRLRR